MTSKISSVVNAKIQDGEVICFPKDFDTGKDRFLAELVTRLRI